MSLTQFTAKNRDAELLAILKEHQAIIPQSATELEGAILGALLTESSQLSNVVTTLQPEDFYDPKNETIYSAMLSMADNHQKIDLLTVSQSVLIKEAKIPIAYIAELTQKVGSASHVTEHSRIVKQKSIARGLLSAGLEIISQANNETLDVADTLTNATSLIDKIAEKAAGGKGGQHIRQLANEALRDCEKRCIAYANGRPTGVTTGLYDLDRLTGGWQPSQLIILAARPAMGKTALMLHFAKSAAKQGVPVCIYSLEMSDVSLANRLLLSECNVEVDNFRAGRLSTSEWHELEKAASSLARLPIYVDDKASVTMRYIKSHSSIMAKKGKCGLIMCDYLQLADMSTGERGRSREQEVTATSAKAKGIAKELNVPFVMLSQLNRAVEGRTDKKPVLSDLRESGSIEQDADIVALIYRPAYYGDLTITVKAKGDSKSDIKREISSEGIGILAVAKQRDGATGDVEFRHNPSMSKIYDKEETQYLTSTPETHAMPF